MDVLQALHDSEINYTIAVFFDGCFTVKLGDDLNRVSLGRYLSNDRQSRRRLGRGRARILSRQRLCEGPQSAPKPTS